MRVVYRDEDGVRVVEVIGNIRTNDDYSAFKKTIDETLEEGKVKIILNFKEVNFINSSGLGRLALAAKRAKEAKGILVISNLSEDLAELFSFTRLDSKIKVVKTEEEGFEAVKS